LIFQGCCDVIRKNEIDGRGGRRDDQSRWCRWRRPGLYLINVLLAAFAPVDPKSVKRYWQFDWFLTLLGSTSIKAVRWTLMKSTPGSLIHQHFTCSSYKCRSQMHKKTVKSPVLFCNFGTYKCKSFEWNVNEIDSKCQFQQYSMSSFRTRRSQKFKKDLTAWLFFGTFGICERKCFE